MPYGLIVETQSFRNLVGVIWPIMQFFDDLRPVDSSLGTSISHQRIVFIIPQVRYVVNHQPLLIADAMDNHSIDNTFLKKMILVRILSI